MDDLPFNTAQLQNWIVRLRRGDSSAREELVRRSSDRLLRLARRMLRDNPRLRRWTETADVYQTAAMSLLRALQTETPTSTQAFFRLAALQIRRELLNLARRLYGPRGAGTHHASHHDDAGEAEAFDPPDPRGDRNRLVLFHDLVESLPEHERDVVDQLYYFEFTREEAAENLGVSVSTVDRRWRSARSLLHRQLQDEHEE